MKSKRIMTTKKAHPRKSTSLDTKSSNPALPLKVVRTLLLPDIASPLLVKNTSNENRMAMTIPKTSTML